MRQLTEAEINAVYTSLRFYNPANDQDHGVLDMDALKRMEDIFEWDGLAVHVNDDTAPVATGPCGICEHAHGDHWTANDRQWSGCAADTSAAYACQCEGFSNAD